MKIGNKKMKINKKLATLGVISAGVLALAGCTSDADRSSENLSTAAEHFEIQRTIVATNGITGQVMFYAEGRCSLETADSFLAGAIEIVCKTGPDEYYKHFYIKGDQDQMAITQEKPIDVSEYHTRIVLKPQNVIPEFDIMLGEDE
jgi:hypothetical protein